MVGDLIFQRETGPGVEISNDHTGKCVKENGLFDSFNILSGSGVYS